MICPICGFFVDDDDYWCGDKCLRCALDAITAKPPPVPPPSSTDVKLE